MKKLAEKWWHNSVVYQIYPKSFQDTNGDGIGDLMGIIQRLDYLELLGIDAIWLSPVYQSPNHDNGYDISDYENIMDDYGTMEDMDNLIQAASQRNIKIVMDLVVNHTSDEHPWFIEAQQSPTSPYRDYYVWRDPSSDGQVPNELRSAFGGTAWKLDEKSNQYYLHIFGEKQPDLNWENQAMRKDIWKMMNFWLEKGIGGFRLDVIDLVGKKPDELITDNGPKLHEYLQEMNRETFGNYDVMTVGETWSATPELAKLYSNPDRKELSMVFQFEHVGLDEIPGQEKWDVQALDFIKLKSVFGKWQTAFDGDGWNSLFWNNHDLPRIISRWGNDSEEYRELSGKMLATILHMQKGTPFIFQGEELGMINTPVSTIDEINDIESLQMYQERLAAGYKSEDLIASINSKGRDNARRPMQWNADKNAGFTTGTPWQSINSRYEQINAEKSLKDTDSIFYHYKKLIELRKRNPIMVWGDYADILAEDSSIYAYVRSYNDEKWLVAANFYQHAVSFESGQFEAEKIIISNYPDSAMNLSALKLRPYEAVVYKLKK